MKARMHQLDKLEEDRSLTTEEIQEKYGLGFEIKQQQTRVEEFWRQKNRTQWNRAGDRNSAYFHRSAKYTAAKRQVVGIDTATGLLTDPEAIKQDAVAYYTKFFSSQTSYRPNLAGLPFAKLTPEDAAYIERDVSREEVAQAVRECAGDKTPGPDGFSLFIQKAWVVMGEEITQEVVRFFQGGQLPRSAIPSFLTLIPKKGDANKWQDFRPISLVNCLYKIISKIMANRLSQVIKHVVSEVQHGFTSGRQTLDCVLLANEIVAYLKESKQQGILLKLDFEKAYDSVDWRYLNTVLLNMGFGVVWRRWVQECVRANRVSVLLNGSPTKEFTVGRGLRQGCSMSPMLFNIAAEGLHLLLQKAHNHGLISGIGDERGGWNFTHLQFADDTLIFLRNNQSELSNTRSILRWFDLFSGLRVNFHKSTMVCVNVPRQEEEERARSVGCKLERMPFSYLGSKVGYAALSKSCWNPVLQCFSKKLVAWRGKLLSVGGRHTLIKAVLSSLPIYNMSLFPMPKGVLQKCEKIMRGFLWSEEERSGFSKVKWDTVKRPKDHGGLGVADLSVRNTALVLKRVWAACTGSSALWACFLRRRYHFSTLGEFFHLNPKRLSPLMKGFRTICGPWYQAVMRLISFELGNGANTSFWWDNWVIDRPLAVEFPSLYNLAVSKTAKVRASGRFIGTAWVWEVAWLRGLNAWEYEQWLSLQTSLKSPHQLETQDKVIWTSSADGQFTVASCYDALLQAKCPSFPAMAYRTVWAASTPYRINFFLWLLLDENLVTKHFLVRRHVLDTAQDRCSFCGDAPETVTHLFLHCRRISPIWYRMVRWLGGSWNCPITVQSCWMSWGALFVTGNAKARIMWRQAICALLWSIWKARNELVFSGVEFDSDNIIRKTFTNWYYWIRKDIPSFPYTCLEIARTSEWLRHWNG